MLEKIKATKNLVQKNYRFRWQGRKFRTDIPWVQTWPRQEKLNMNISCFQLVTLEIHLIVFAILLQRHMIINSHRNREEGRYPFSFRYLWSTSPWGNTQSWACIWMLDCICVCMYYAVCLSKYEPIGPSFKNKNSL